MAQTPGADDPASPLDALLHERVSAAAKYEQSARDVPASVTIITSEEIARYGFETLSEALDSVRGIYTSYDRNYSYLGVRGFARLSDYNNRLLVLIDGHSLNEPVFGSAPAGTDLVIDMGAVERIEFVRGPSSVLYGTGAMFGVVNVVMKKSEGRATLSSTARIGGDRFRSVAARATGEAGGTKVAISRLLRRTAGADLFFPEFASGGSDGIARGRDYDRSEGMVATISRGALAATVLYGTRTKGVPGASFGSNFNQNEWTVDRHEFVDLSWEHSLPDRLRVALRTYWDHSGYAGHYPASPGTRDDSMTTRYGVESRFTWDVRADDRLTFGTEGTTVTRASYRYFGNNNLSFNEPYVTLAGYVQNEYQPLKNLSITAGLRWERNTAVGSWFSPRAAIVFNPTSASTFKFLYGQAFRAPSAYEMTFSDATNNEATGLKPERVHTIEGVFEQRMSQSWAMFASVYLNRADDLIQSETAANGNFQYENGPESRATGAEIQVDYRPSSGLWAYGSWSVVQSEESGRVSVNSPHDLFKAGLSTDPFRRAHVGADVNYDGSRLALDGSRTSPFLVANLTSSLALTGHLRAGLMIRNVFDRRYSNPVGLEFLSPTMRQDGRTFELVLHVTR